MHVKILCLFALKGRFQSNTFELKNRGKVLNFIYVIKKKKKFCCRLLGCSMTDYSPIENVVFMQPHVLNLEIINLTKGIWETVLL